MSAGRLLAPDDVADMLGVATSTLAKWRQTGDPDLPYLRIAGRIRYRLSDVEEFLEEAEEDDDDDTDDSGNDEEDDSDDDEDDDDPDD